MSEMEYELKKERRFKEFVFEQWRKILCLYVVNEDINRNKTKIEDIDTEKLRTVFQRGYLLAMNQTKVSLENIRMSLDTKDKQLQIIVEDLISEIEDRKITANCYASYKQFSEANYYTDALKREKEMKEYESQKMNQWTDKKM